MATPLLKNWSVISRQTRGYALPADQGVALHGNVYGHPRFRDTSIVTTGELVRIETGGGAAVTRSGTYRLGPMHPAYRDWIGRTTGTAPA